MEFLLFLSLFFLWALLTTVAQFEGHCKWIKLRQFDPFHLLPCWTFFAPKPCVDDYDLVYRDIFEGTITEWQSTNLVRERTWFSFIWNPKKRRTKSLFDMVQLIASQDTDPATPPIFSFPYVWMLNICVGFPKNQLGSQRQFAIVAVRKDSEGIDGDGIPITYRLSLVFISQQH